MNLISRRSQKKMIDYGLQLLTKASRALGRSTPYLALDSIDWDKEEVEAFKIIYQDVWAYICVNIVATSGANLPLGVFKAQPKSKGSELVVQESHWLTMLLEDPNPIQTGSDFIEAIIWSLRTGGQYFIEKVGVKGPDDRPTELYVLDPRQVKVVPDAKNFVKKYQVNVNGIWEDFAPYEISWGKHHNPVNAYEGLSPNTPAGNSISANIAAGKYATMFFRNGGMPIGVMESDRRLSQPDYDRITANWSKSVKSVKNWFKLLILEGGLKYKPVQSSPRELALTELKEQVKGETLAAHGVPRLLAGDSKSVNYANAKEQQKLFWRNTMAPILGFIARRFTKDLLPKGERVNGKVKVMFDLTNVEAIQEDQEIKSRIAFNLSKSYTMTPDEVRKVLYRMQPHANGFGAHLYLPSNMVTAEALIANGGKPLSGAGTGQSGKPGGTDPGSSSEGNKPGASDGKPAKKNFEIEILEALADVYRTGEPSKEEGAEPEFIKSILIG